MELGNHLKKLRFEKGNISQQTLANEVGVTRLTIHSIENGKFNPSTLLALKIARFFELPFEKVFFILED
jgi:putative transcriptional regulator